MKKKEKYSKFKNDSKRPLLAFIAFKELRVIQVYTFEIRMAQKQEKNQVQLSTCKTV